VGEASVSAPFTHRLPNRSKGAIAMKTAVNNATEYRNLPLALLTESKTNPRRTFEDDSLKELADFVSGHKIGL
jgi:ADP-ribosylglycohydrolase